jgi:hypothetical protein
MVIIFFPRPPVKCGTSPAKYDPNRRSITTPFNPGETHIKQLYSAPFYPNLERERRVQVPLTFLFICNSESRFMARIKFRYFQKSILYIFQ